MFRGLKVWCGERARLRTQLEVAREWEGIAETYRNVILAIHKSIGLDVDPDHINPGCNARLKQLMAAEHKLENIKTLLHTKESDDDWD